VDTHGKVRGLGKLLDQGGFAPEAGKLSMLNGTSKFVF